jgi:NADH:ubiquinone oxidoreductase subunit D
MFVQFGPQHPGSHGLIKFTLEMLGETIRNSILYIGLLHRGTEKLFETRPFYMGTPYMDRLDYVSTLTSEHAHVLGIEGLIDYQVASAAFLKIRTVFDEITRIKNHLMHISILTFDTGNFFIFFFFLEWREHLMGFYEAVSGARLHAALYRPFETRFSYFNSYLIDSMFSYFNYFLFFFKNFFQPLLFFRVLKLRFMGIGSMSKNFVKNASISGVIARSCGLKYDARASYQTTYAFYKYLSFKIFTGDYGDLYDRMLLMVGEIVESVLIIVQTLFRVFVQSLDSSQTYGQGTNTGLINLNYVLDSSVQRQYV